MENNAYNGCVFNFYDIPKSDIFKLKTQLYFTPRSVITIGS